MFGFHRRAAQLDRIEARQDLILDMLETLARRWHRMAGELDKLEQDVTEVAAVVDSAVTLLNGLKAALDAAIASGDMSRVAAVNAELEVKTAALAAAVAANTPGPH